MKNLILILIATATLAACSKGEQPTPGAPIKFGVDVSAVSGSRAPYIPADNSSILAYVIGVTNLTNLTQTVSNAAGDINFTTDGTSYGWSPSAYYPIESTVYLWGMYPHDQWTIGATSASATLDGKTDLMASLATATTKVDGQIVNSQTNYKTLTFKHILTLLNIYVKGSTGAQGVWGNITSVTLKSINTSVAVTPSTTANTALFSAPADGFGLWYFSAPGVYSDNAFTAPAIIDESGTVNPFVYSIVSPKTVVTGLNSGVYTLSIATVNYPTAFDVPINLTVDAGKAGSTSGKSFDITLSITAQAINATATLTDWNDGGSNDIDLY